jgi:hypothetical protein
MIEDLENFNNNSKNEKSFSSLAFAQDTYLNDQYA